MNTPQQEVRWHLVRVLMSILLWQMKQTCWSSVSSGVRPRSLRLRLNAMTYTSRKIHKTRSQKTLTFIEIQSTNQNSQCCHVGRGSVTWVRVGPGGIGGYTPPVYPRGNGHQSRETGIHVGQVYKRHEASPHSSHVLLLGLIAFARTNGQENPKR